MLQRLSLPWIVAGSVALLLPLFAVGWLTREDPGEKPYLNVLGGGFMFNYREGEVYYAFTAVVQKPLPTGSVIEAEFQDPAGGDAHVVRQRVGGVEMTRYAFRSPPVRGVEAGEPYHVAIRVLDRSEENLIWSRDMDFRSQISDDVVPDKPLVIGPGYHKNPAVEG